MARYGRDHKSATRQRIIESAARRFKETGFDGTGIATVVADAGLTNGAFYGHFSSKDDLIASVVTQQLAEQVACVEALPDGLAAVEGYVRDYLSPRHRDDPANGCPSAALLDEISRCDQSTREAYTDGAHAMVNAIARRLDPAQPDAATDRALGLYTLLVASVQLARAITDPELSERVLAAAYANALTLATAGVGLDLPTELSNAPFSTDQESL